MYLQIIITVFLIGQSSNSNFYTTKTQKGCETTEVGLASYDEQISIYIVGNNIVT